MKNYEVYLKDSLLNNKRGSIGCALYEIRTGANVCWQDCEECCEESFKWLLKDYCKECTNKNG